MPWPLFAALVACEPGGATAKVHSDSGPPESGATSHSGYSDSRGDSGRDTGHCESSAWYADADGDGFGDPASPIEACVSPPGYVADATDCDDAHAEAYPGAAERLTNGVDDDCDGTPAATSVADLPVVALTGVEEYQHLGTSLGLDDLDGDGVPELVLGVTLQVVDGEYRMGGAYILPGAWVRGGAGSWEVAAVAHLYAANYESANMVCPVGDVDGDGQGDLVLGGPYDNANYFAGIAYLARGPFVGEIDLTTDAQVFEGDSMGQALGVCAGPGDLDGDGLADVVIGANEAYAAGYGAGAAYVLRGPVSQSSIYEADTILQGNEFHERLGDRVFALGDLDGDGMPDFGVTNHNSEGRDGLAAYLVTDHLPGVMHPRAVGVTVQCSAGAPCHAYEMQLNRVGDVTGDGHDDVAIGLDWGSPGTDSYHLTLFAGPFGAEPRLDNSADYDMAFVSSAGGPTRWLTFATGLGDWDRDGHNDLAISDPAFATDEALAEPGYDCVEDGYCRFGAVYLLASPFGPGVIDLATAADRIEGEHYGGHFGQSLAGGADLDGDGYPDLAIGAPQAAAPVSTQGAAYVLFGGGYP